MNDGVFVTRKTFGSVEDTLSAFYQLWMLPDMQDRANFVGYTEFDIEFEDHVSAYARNGISEQAFCAFFHPNLLERLSSSRSIREAMTSSCSGRFRSRNSSRFASVEQGTSHSCWT